MIYYKPAMVCVGEIECCGMFLKKVVDFSVYKYRDSLSWEVCRGAEVKRVDSCPFIESLTPNS